jgi:hypothetical protein
VIKIRAAPRKHQQRRGSASIGPQRLQCLCALQIVTSTTSLRKHAPHPTFASPGALCLCTRLASRYRVQTQRGAVGIQGTPPSPARPGTADGLLEKGLLVTPCNAANHAKFHALSSRVTTGGVMGDLNTLLVFVNNASKATNG